MILGAQSQAAEIVDRLLVEVNRRSYSHRQFMVFHTIKRGFEVPAGKDLDYLDAKNWQMPLLRFTYEMIVSQEAARISSIQPNDKNVSLIYDAIEARRQKDPRFALELNQLAVEDNEIVDAISVYLRIRRYAAGRAGTAQPEARAAIDLTKEAWFANLRDRTPYRFYDEANRYEPLAKAIKFK